MHARSKGSGEAMYALAKPHQSVCCSKMCLVPKSCVLACMFLFFVCLRFYRPVFLVCVCKTVPLISFKSCFIRKITKHKFMQQNALSSLKDCVKFAL